MLGVLALAPVIGLIWGLVTKRMGWGLSVGLAVGVGNYALWTVYNAITEKLGLDTVKNLLVNLGLFVVISIIIGAGAGVYAARAGKQQAHQGGTDADVERDRTR